MFWTEEILQVVNRETLQVINDSKTPSGEPHVGSLRGVLIHDAIFKTLQAKGIPVQYRFGSDDYDPLDEIPKGQNEHFEKYLGQPLCNVPAPPGSMHRDMADHFITGFFDIFERLGVTAQKYRMRDVYRNGEFNEVIDKILNQSAVIRQIYRTISGSEKSAKWYPFQAICECCGRIGTTEVIDYDGREVTYVCRPDMVKWAKGCGFTGKRSPFDGQGKLPWKLEWVAKWLTFGITIEGAGMDHTTKGGSRDVAASVLKNVFGVKAPLNIPYGFFLVEGAKMSSSKGIGVTAREMAGFLSEETLRYLMLSTPPKRAINFSPTEAYIIKLHNDFDATKDIAFTDGTENVLQKELYSIAEPYVPHHYQIPGFSLIKVLIQFSHMDIFKVAETIKGSALTGIEQLRLEERVRSAWFWLRHYAAEDEKFEIQEALPANTYQVLSLSDLGFIKRFEKDLTTIDWTENAIQHQVFNSSRLTPTPGKDSFKALYKIFLNKDKGPQIGRLLFYLGKEFVFKRLGEIKVDLEKFLSNHSMQTDEFEQLILSEKEDIVEIKRQPRFICNRLGGPDHQPFIKGAGFLEFLIKKTEGYWHMRRVMLCRFEGFSQEDSERRAFESRIDEFIEEAGTRCHLGDTITSEEKTVYAQSME